MSTSSLYKKLALDSMYVVVSLGFALIGFWALHLVEASLFSTVAFSVLVTPCLFSSVMHLIRDVSRTAHQSHQSAA